MAAVQFKTMSDFVHEAEVRSMMTSLYIEDPSGDAIDASHFERTIRTLIANPGQGRIVLFMDGSNVVGYAILIPFWSNEFGGNIVSIDEFFVTPGARHQGIGRAFIDLVVSDRPFEAVAAMVETTPGNLGARRLYASAGFRRSNNLCLTRILLNPPGSC